MGRTNAFAHNSSVGDIITIGGEQYEVVLAMDGDPVAVPRDHAGKFDLRGFEVIYDSERSGAKADKLSESSSA